MLDLQSLFKLSYPMCIVSSMKDGKLNGCIVNTVFQIVPEPPMVAVSINRQCLTHEFITNSRIFTVSVLSQDTPMSFIGRFGFRTGRDIEKFRQINYRTGKTGAPIILDNTATFLEAEVCQSIDVKTHTLFIAQIVSCQTLDDNKIPMTYAYYRDVKQGRTPQTAATYIKVEPKTVIKKWKGTGKMKKYRCIMCEYIYDPDAGDTDNGVEPGTAFEDLPDNWVCPDCGAGKDQFEAIEE